MIRINLAPAEAHRRRGPGFSFTLPAFNLAILFGIVYVVAALGVGAWWWSLGADATRLAAEVDRGNKELEGLKATLGQGANVKAQVAEMKKRVAVIEDLTKGQARPIVMLDAFASTVPSQLWITTLVEKDSLLTVSGTAFSTTAVSDFMNNLRTSGKFKDVDIKMSKQDLTKTPSFVTFEVTCRFEG